MKKSIVFVTILLSGIATMAQGEKPALKQEVTKEESVKPRSKGAPMANNENQISEMDKVVGLSDEQRNKIAVINQEQNDKMKLVRTKYANSQETADKEAMRTEIQAIQAERKSRVRQVLTDEQHVKWTEHQKGKRGEMPNKRPEQVQKRPKQQN